MEHELLLKEVVEIALGSKKPRLTAYFSNVELDADTIRWGCDRILIWLRAQSVAFRPRPLELDLASEPDVACIKLVEEAGFLQKVVQIKERKLMFNENVPIEQALRMMMYAKENYNPRVFTKD
jgi:hypothetical protein